MGILSRALGGCVEYRRYLWGLEPWDIRGIEAKPLQILVCIRILGGT